MLPPSSPYTFRDSYTATFEVSVATVSTMEVYLDGELVEPVSGSYTLYGPDGTSLTTPSVSIVSGVATVTVPGTAVDSLGEGYRERWVLTLPDGSSPAKFRDAAVCLSPLRCPISDVDIEQAHPDINRMRNASAASWQGFIDQAWGRILRKLRNTGELPYVIVSTSSLYDPALHLSMHLIYLWFYGQTGNEHFKTLADDQWEKWTAAWAEVSYTVDRDQDGTQDSEDRQTAARGAIVYPNPSPNRYRRYGKRRCW